MTTNYAIVQLPHGWLFRDSAGDIGYQNAIGQKLPLGYAAVQNDVDDVQRAVDKLKEMKHNDSINLRNH